MLNFRRANHSTESSENSSKQKFLITKFRKCGYYNLQAGIFGRMESDISLFCFRKYSLFNVNPALQVATLNISQFFSFRHPPFFSLQLLQIGMARLIHITCRENTSSKYLFVIAKKLTLLRYLVSNYVYFKVGKQYLYSKLLIVSTNT